MQGLVCAFVSPRVRHGWQVSEPLFDVISPPTGTTRADFDGCWETTFANHGPDALAFEAKLVLEVTVIEETVGHGKLLVVSDDPSNYTRFLHVSSRLKKVGMTVRTAAIAVVLKKYF